MTEAAIVSGIAAFAVGSSSSDGEALSGAGDGGYDIVLVSGRSV